MFSRKHEPLTPFEHSDLAAFVRANAGHDLVFVSGFFAALASAPSTIQPSQWMQVLWEDPAFENQQHAQHVFNLVFKQYNFVVSAVHSDPARICPSPDDDELVGEFCEGYFAGVCLDSAWVHDETGMMMAFPIAALGGDVDREDLEGDEEIGDVDAWFDRHRKELPQHITDLHAYWLERRRPPAVEAKVKVGRNDPCPCGSGKKYKKCCGGN